MANVIEHAVTSKLVAWIQDNRPSALNNVPILAGNREGIRTRPCVVVLASDATVVQPLDNTARMTLEFYVFTQVDDTPEADHHAYAAALRDLLRDRNQIQNETLTNQFKLHDLIPRSTSEAPDEERGRETILTYEAVASSV